MTGRNEDVENDLPKLSEDEQNQEKTTKVDTKVQEEAAKEREVSGGYD